MGREGDRREERSQSADFAAPSRAVGACDWGMPWKTLYKSLFAENGSVASRKPGKPPGKLSGKPRETNPGRTGPRERAPSHPAPVQPSSAPLLDLAYVIW